MSFTTELFKKKAEVSIPATTPDAMVAMAGLPFAVTLVKG